jgi:multiple sugar transport system permease protein
MSMRRPSPRVTPLREQRRRNAPKVIGIYLLLVLGAIPLIYPFLWMIASSFRTLEEIANADLSIWPSVWHFDNYSQVFSSFPFWQYIRNSVISTAVPVVGAVLTSSMVGFAFARVQAPGRNVLFLVLLSTMLLPGQILIIPQFVLFKELGMLNTLYPLMLPSCFGTAFFIFLFRQFYARLPLALEEAATMDGCNLLQTWWAIFIPLSKAALIAVGVLEFMWRWNDFFGPVIYLSSDTYKTLPLALAGFQSTFSTQTNLLMAASAIVILPCVILFFLAQRAFLEGLTFTGSKET